MRKSDSNNSNEIHNVTYFGVQFEWSETHYLIVAVIHLISPANITRLELKDEEKKISQGWS